eukprot:CAMPEP_0172328180 /NCGR_PEP_ID=MMETSP1058-20130122/60218_1 /TAXON_ID=83371 /ORGANISM="Detonula confervacea, Strain CCMP 353" /LENGTH=79 /DNA_ID=CAMNT_0013045283 /DNA_START=1149 /DNA_END=1384 /DNA_ORIENTATION=+
MAVDAVSAPSWSPSRCRVSVEVVDGDSTTGEYTHPITSSSGHDPAPTNEPLNPLHVWIVVLPRRRILPAMRACNATTPP